MPLTRTTLVQMRMLSSILRPLGSNAKASPVCPMPSASKANVGGIELLKSDPGTPIIATG